MDGTRQLCERRFPEIPASAWLPPSFDEAVTGAAERASMVVPVYSFPALLACVDGNAAERRFAEVSETLASHPDVAVLYTNIARKQFWEDVRKGRKIVWEGFHPAIRGVMAFGAEVPHAAVYDRSLVVSILADLLMNSDEHGEDPVKVALRDYETKMKPCDAGPPTPWYLFTPHELA